MNKMERWYFNHRTIKVVDNIKLMISELLEQNDPATTVKILNDSQMFPDYEFELGDGSIFAKSRYGNGIVVHNINERYTI